MFLDFDDYIPSSQTLAFEPYGVKECVVVVIVDDVNVEQTESFTVSLEVNNDMNGRIHLDVPSAQVTILNDDGEIDTTVHVMCAL